MVDGEWCTAPWSGTCHAPDMALSTTSAPASSTINIVTR
jgi:hypothetical protein